MKRPGGETRIGGAAANYISTALPFDFTLENVVDEDANRPFTQTVYEVMYVPNDGEANKDVNNIEVRELYSASALGKEFDKYFKWISEDVLQKYGAKLDLDAQGKLQYNDEGELLYQWNDGPIKTADGLALTARW